MRKTEEQIKSQKFVTTIEASMLLNVTQTTLIEWEKKGKLKSVKTLGGHRRIPMKEIERLQKKMGFDKLEENEEETTEKT